MLSLLHFIKHASVIKIYLQNLLDADVYIDVHPCQLYPGLILWYTLDLLWACVPSPHMLCCHRIWVVDTWKDITIKMKKSTNAENTALLFLSGIDTCFIHFYLQCFCPVKQMVNIVNVQISLFKLTDWHMDKTIA